MTFISGDVHVGAFGCFQAHPKQYNKVIDEKFMLQVGIRAHSIIPFTICLFVYLFVYEKFMLQVGIRAYKSMMKLQIRIRLSLQHSWVVPVWAGSTG